MAIGCGLLLTGLPAAPTSATSTAHSSPAPATQAAGLDALRLSDDAPDGSVAIELIGMSPVVVTPDSGLTITGRVHNLSDVPVTVDEVEALTSYRGLDTRDLLVAWEEGRGAITAQRPLGSDAIDTTLDPGTTWPFTIEIPAEDVEPPFDFASLPLLIDAHVSIDTEGSGSTLLTDISDAIDGVIQLPDQEDEAGAEGGQAADDTAATAPTAPPEVTPLRTYLVWSALEDAEVVPLQVGTLIPLTAPADADLWSTDPDTHRGAWDDITGPGSANAALVSSLIGRPVTFMTDPSLINPTPPPSTLYDPPSPEPPEDEPTTAPAEPPDDVSDEQPEDPAAPPTDEAGETSGPPVDGPDEPTTTAEPGDQTGDDPSVQGPESEIPDAGDADLTELIEELEAGQLWWTPAGDPDFARLVDLGWTPDEAAAALGDRSPGSPDPDDALPGDAPPATVAWPEHGNDPIDLEWLASTWPDILRATDGTDTGTDLRAVVQPGSALGAATSIPPGIGEAESGLRVLAYDETLSSLLADDATGSAEPAEQVSGDGSAIRAQRLIADTLAVYQAQPEQERSLLLAAPRGETIDGATLSLVLDGLEESPWVDAVSAHDLAESSPDDVPSVTLTEPATPSLLGPGLIDQSVVDQIEDVTARLDAGSAMVAGGEDRRDAWIDTLGEAYSVRWRADESALAAMIEQAAPVADEVLESLEVIPTTINFLADEGQIQVHVVNHLPVTMENIDVTLTPSHHRLRVVEPAEPVTIGPESRANVQFFAEAIAAGDVGVDVTLSTPNGTSMGEVTGVQVRVQPLGTWLYWVLLSVAGVILVIGLWRALRPKKEASPAIDHDDGAGNHTTTEQTEEGRP